MTHPQLRLAAAKFALNLANIDDLVNASHAALDFAMYADGLAVLATTPNMVLWEATPHFTAAIRELDHAFTSQDGALQYVRLTYFGPIAEETGRHLKRLGQYHREVHSKSYQARRAGFHAWEEPSAQALMDHWDARRHRLSEAEREMDPRATSNAMIDWGRQAISLCRGWCREYARLYLQPAWRSHTVLALASGIHAEGAFDRLPILADALEEAGCDHPDLLGHCRYPSPHTDYCWLVDAVLANGATQGRRADNTERREPGTE